MKLNFRKLMSPNLRALYDEMTCVASVKHNDGVFYVVANLSHVVYISREAKLRASRPAYILAKNGTERFYVRNAYPSGVEALNAINAHIATL
jgi:hypothetical protein